MISNEENLKRLGRDVLVLPDYEVRSVMHNKKYALAAREILELWRKNQPTTQDACNKLITALKSAGWGQLTEDLREWVQAGEKDC